MPAFARVSVASLALTLVCAASNLASMEAQPSELAVVRLSQRPRPAPPQLKKYPNASIFRVMGQAAPGSGLPLTVPAGPLDLVVRCDVQLGFPQSENERSFTPEGGPGGFAYVEVERQVVVEAGRNYEPECFKVDGGWSARLVEISPGS